MVTVNILAAGSGSRMNNPAKPKQFLKINEKEIIIHTLEKFLLNQNIDLIIISLSQQWIDYTKKLLELYKLNDEKVKLIEGGDTRTETILKSVEFLKEIYPEEIENQHLITHDSVRPFISSRIIEEHISNVQKFDIVNTIIPAEDTIVKISDNIVEIPNRDEFYQGQTPQSFKISKYEECYKKLNDDQKKILTDVVKIFSTVEKEKVLLHNVMGEKSNMKITTPLDLQLACCLVGVKND